MFEFRLIFRLGEDGMRVPMGPMLFACLVLATLADAGVDNAALLKHRKATPRLPEDHNRLRRKDNAGPHTPEQVRYSKLSGVL